MLSFSVLLQPHLKYHPAMHTRPALLLIVSLSLAGCHKHPVTTAFPNHVSPNEVAVYQAYLQDFYIHSEYPHKMWYVETETWPYRTEPYCDKQLVERGVNPAYLQALRDLGTARYPIPAFNIDYARTFDAWGATINGAPPDHPFISYTFSRVTFSPDGRQAFFHVEWVRGPGMGQGGWGDDFLADQQGSAWHFRRVGCPSIID